MRPAIIIALLLLVSAAAAAPPEKRSLEPQHGQCDVGVVSNLGEKFTVKEHDLDRATTRALAFVTSVAIRCAKYPPAADFPASEFRRFP